MDDWHKLISVFPEYGRLLSEAGVRTARLVYPSGESEGLVLTEKSYGEQCGAVVAEASLFCRGGQLVLQCRISRSAAGNRGWNGGSRGYAPKSAAEAAKITLAYFAQARQILS
jgi:hypothetical protein